MATARSIAHAVDAKAGYVPGHSDGVGYLMGMMAREAGYHSDTLHQLELAALLHDSGKLLIPDAILLVERKLTLGEYEVIKTHSIHSERIARSLDGAEMVVPWIRHHHERWDGTGYPDGLRGDEIPWPSRLLLVADAFHVMTTDRPYQRSRTRVDALRELEAKSESQFCPTATELLMSRGIWNSAYPQLDAPPMRMHVETDYSTYVDELHVDPSDPSDPRDGPKP